MQKHVLSNKVVALFYLLLKDEIAPGRLEKLVSGIENVEDDDKFIVSNRHLALYAEELHIRLTTNKVKNSTQNSGNGENKDMENEGNG